ncbi:MAG: acetylornithine transaminase [Halobacteria archaeon]
MSLTDREKRVLIPTYKRQPVAVSRAEGNYLWDASGRKYLDFFSGVSVNLLGHRHPAVLKAIQEQVRRYLHVSNHYLAEPQVALAERLAKVSGLERTFFCNSGAEAVEGALKLAAKATGRREFVAAHDAFHGRTIGALSVTHDRRFRDPFSHILLKSVKFVPYNDIKALRFVVGPDTAGVILEPIQGEGGVHVASDDYLREVRALCDEKGALLILDEVQTGLGRTGRWFAKDHAGVQPDILALGKALGGGLPLGAVVAKEAWGLKFGPGDHGSTFGGNPLSCAAGLAVLSTLEKQKLVERAAKLGARLLEGLRAIPGDRVKEVRGRGLFAGIALRERGEEVVERMRKRKILINTTGPDVLRLLPPLTVSEREVDQVVAALKAELGRLGPAPGASGNVLSPPPVRP